MFAQIYSIQSAEEALACIEAGADRIGVLSEEPGGKYPVRFSLFPGNLQFSFTHS